MLRATEPAVGDISADIHPRGCRDIPQMRAMSIERVAGKAGISGERKAVLRDVRFQPCAAAFPLSVDAGMRAKRVRAMAVRRVVSEADGD